MQCEQNKNGNINSDLGRKCEIPSASNPKQKPRIRYRPRRLAMQTHPDRDMLRMYLVTHPESFTHNH